MENSRIVYIRDTTVQRVIIDWIPNTYTFQVIAEPGDKYKEDPAKVNADAIDALSIDDIAKFYEQNIKGKPVTIILMGDKKKIDLKAIEKKIGCKVTTLSTAKLFNDVQEVMDEVMPAGVY